MNNLQREKRYSRSRKAHLEYLDSRIVPAAMHPTFVAAADVASDSVSVHSQQHREVALAGEPEIQIRHADRIATRAERREAALEKREARIIRLDTWYQAGHPIIVTSPPQKEVIPVASSNSTPATTAQGTSGSSPSGSGTGSGAGSAARVVLPSSPATTSGPSGSVIALPPNVSQQLDTVYEEYES